MADNTTLNSGTGGDVIASDDIGGVKHQRVKISVGADGSAADCSTASPLPISGPAAHDAAVSGSPVLAGGYASAAAPTDVSADGDAVRQWHLRNGSQVVNLAAAGSLIGATSNALDINVKSGGIAGIADDAAFTPGTSEVLPIGFHADEASVDSVNEGDIGAARMSLDRKQYVIAHNETSTIYQNGTARTPTFLVIDAASSGDNTLLAAQGSGNKIRVHQLMLVSAGTVNVRFESAAGGTALTGQMNLVANTGFVLPYSPMGWFETVANELLNLELSGAVSVDGVLAYTVVT